MLVGYRSAGGSWLNWWVKAPTDESWLNKWVMDQQGAHGLTGGSWFNRWVMAQQVSHVSTGESWLNRKVMSQQVITALQVVHDSTGGS